MPVGVAEEDLPGAIGLALFGGGFGADILQVSLPGVDVVHLKCEMVPAITGKHGFVPIPNQVQFLLGAEPKPGAGKIKSRTRHRFQPQDPLIKVNALCHARDVKSDMVQLKDSHRFRLTVTPRQFSRTHASDVIIDPHGSELVQPFQFLPNQILMRQTTRTIWPKPWPASLTNDLTVKTLHACHAYGNGFFKLDSCTRRATVAE